MIQTLPVIEPSKSNIRPEIIHIVCCDLKKALCGWTDDWTDIEVDSNDDDTCRVCLDLEEAFTGCSSAYCVYRYSE